MADIKELDSIIQIDNINYAVVAEKLANKLTISVAQGDAATTQIAEFNGSEATTATITIPKIPTKVSELTNDSNYLTTNTIPSDYVTEDDLSAKGYLVASVLEAYALKTEIPAGADLSQYAKKSDIPNITINQNEPTGGAAGDIWFKY